MYNSMSAYCPHDKQRTESQETRNGEKGKLTLVEDHLRVPSEHRGLGQYHFSDD